MHPYLPHLLADIKAAHKKEGKEPEQPQEGLENHFREIDRWLSGDSEHTLGFYCGLESGDFPPGEQFAEEEIRQVCSAFEKMLASWGATIDMPQTLPLFKRYELMVGLLDQKFTPLEVGTFVFDFCTGYATDCELGEYCSCLEYWKEE